MNNIRLWAELKEDVVESAFSLSSILHTEAGRLAVECGQRPDDRVRIMAGDAVIEINKFCVKIMNKKYRNKDEGQTALTAHWKGRRGDWMIIEEALRGLISSWKVREVLVARL